jgi:hypothetical protein
VRVFQKYDIEKNKWLDIDIKELKKDDIFRIFDDGVMYVDKKDGRCEWIVTGDRYMRNKEGYIFIECG